MQYVIPKVGHQNGGPLGHVNDLAHRMGGTTNHIKFFAMQNDLVSTPVRQGDGVRVLEALQKPETDLQLSA